MIEQKNELRTPTTLDQQAKLRELHDFAEINLKRMEGWPDENPVKDTLEKLHDFVAARLNNHAC